MEEDKGLFLVLESLRSELEPFRMNDRPSAKLADLLQRIEETIKGLAYHGEEARAVQLIENSLHSIGRARRIATHGLRSEATVIARTTLTILLARQGLFR